jgi:hypothetical protein
VSEIKPISEEDAVPFRRLLTYGMAQISDGDYAGAVDRLFTAPEAPVNFSRFQGSAS